MATSKARALFLLVSATSALFLSSTVVDAVCVPRMLTAPHKKLPQTTRPFYVRTSPASVAPKKLAQSSAAFPVRTLPASVAPKKLAQSSFAFPVRTSPASVAPKKLAQTSAAFPVRTSPASVAPKKLAQTSAAFPVRTLPASVAPKKLAQSRAAFPVRTLPFVAPKKLAQTSAAFPVRTSPASVAPKKPPQTSAFFIRPRPQPLNSGITTQAVQVVDHAVVDICHQTDYPEVCIPSVSAHLKGTANTLSVLTAAMEACTEKTKSAATDVAKLAADPSTSASVKMALSTCKENYGSALDSLSRAQKANAAHDIGTLNSELSAVITYATTCDDSYAEMKVKSPPLAGADRILQKLGSNCLAIAAQAHV